MNRILSITARQLWDPFPDTSYLQQPGFEDRYQQFHNGDFSFIGIQAEAEIVAHGVCQTITSGGLWGIESDSDRSYLAAIAEDNPRTEFLAFTKAFDIVNDYENSRAIPGNLVIIFSAWPRMRIDNPHRHPVAWVQDGTEHRVPKNALGCPGNCQSCGTCFEMPRLGQDVAFNKH